MIPIFRLKFLLLFFGSFSIFGQQTSIYTHELKEFDNAISLYKDMQFQSAQILFEKGYFIDNSNQKIECLIKNVSI